MIPPNPKDDPKRLAAAHWFPRNVRRTIVAPFVPTTFEKVLTEMCDKHSYANRTYLANHARIYRYVYHNHAARTLVDEWEDIQLMVPVAIVFTTTAHLLKWADAEAIQGGVLSRGRLELHEHVKRMSAYLQYRLDEIEKSHEHDLEETP